MLTVILGGVGAGLVHVFSGPDHLAAIAPLALKQQQRAWLLGLRWGVGHSSGVAFVGLISLLLRGVLPLDRISGWGDRVVGLSLVALGLWALRKAVRIHAHAHDHDGQKHVHVHSHAPKALWPTWTQKFLRCCTGPHSQDDARHHHLHRHAAFGFGTLHGVAGSSHFLAILPSLALPSFTLATSYLLAYGGGTVLAMMAFSGMIGSLSEWLAISARFYRPCMIASALGAIVIGCFWLSGLSC